MFMQQKQRISQNVLLPAFRFLVKAIVLNLEKRTIYLGIKDNFNF